MPVAKPIPRRDFLLTSAAGGIACFAGCKPSSQQDSTASVRTDVPLRVLICGDPSWGDAIKTAWGGIAQQPLTIEILSLAEPENGDTDGPVSNATAAASKPSSAFARRVIDSLARNDVAIVPCGVIPDVYESESLMPLGSDVVDDEELQSDLFYPVIGESLMRWAGKPIAVPLGCLQPSMLANAAVAAKLGQGGDLALPKTWDEFDQTLQKVAGDSGAAAEPLAGGAAAKMFLWRASEAAPPIWLFDRVTFEPVLTQDVYVKVLQTMYENAQRYGEKRLTAGEVWNGVATGKISVAFGWPAAFGDPPRVESIGDTIAGGLPGQPVETKSTDEAASGPGAVLPDPDAPLAVISSRCRQTVAAKRFLIWLSGGDGSEMIRTAVGPMTQIRRPASSDDNDSTATSASDYASFLSSRLASLKLRPTLRLHGYDRYMAALDREVLLCIDGKKSAAEALDTVSQAWKTLTDEIGNERQAKAWRLAQGLRN